MAAFLDAVAVVGIGKPVSELVPFKVKVTLLEEEELFAAPKPLSLKLNVPASFSPVSRFNFDLCYYSRSIQLLF